MQNWLWIALGLGAVALFAFRGGGCGMGHGGHDHRREPDKDRGREDPASPAITNSTAEGGAPLTGSHGGAGAAQHVGRGYPQGHRHGC